MLHDNAVVDVVLFIAALLPSIILHEVAHGVVALRLGDSTAKDAGRLTLNPIPHIDPFGSIILPFALAMARMNVFGWAKPVPVNPSRFQRPIEGMAVTSLAGPATNLLLALAVGRLGPFQDVGGVIFLTSDALWARLLFGLLVVNAALAVFNMLPIPPLDGSKLLPLLLPPRAQEVFFRVSQYGFIILFALVFVFRDALAFLGSWIGAVIRFVV
jgi:Zn-dependent protease